MERWSRVKMTCPICGGEIEIPDDSLPGEVFEHEECGAQLELYKDEKGNLKLRLLEGVSEDWGE